MGVRGRLILGVVVLAMALPPAALAGKKVVVHQESLQIQVRLSSTKAGARLTTVRLYAVYKNPKHPGKQPPYNTKSVIFVLPKGLALHPRNAPACKESIQVNNNGSVNGCPAASKIGTGKIVVNAAPTIPGLIPAALTIYNGIDDGGYGGYPTGSRLLIFYLHTSLGLNTTEFFHIVKSGGSYKLISNMSKPASPGITPGTFSLQTVDLTLKSSANKPFFTNPGTCTGSWGFFLKITNFFGQPSITAQDTVNCRS